MSTHFIPGNQLAKIATKDRKIQIHHVVGWEHSYHSGLRPIIPTAPDLTMRDITAIGTYTPEGVLWSVVDFGVCPDGPIYHPARLGVGEFEDDRFGGF